MSKKFRFIPFLIIVACLLVIAFRYLTHVNIPILEPAGEIALKERNLMFFALILSLIVVIPVFSATIFFAWKYRESNVEAKYSPEMDHGPVIEATWWLIPSAIILVLSIVTWNSSYALSPYKPIASKNPQMTIQVIALDWKWLFIYPQQDIATVNYIQIPENTPVEFEITSDAPMNSFWVPQLGGQIYAMPGMSTELNLIANKIGTYSGSSANISGEGFAGMTFSVKSSSNTDFSNWVQSVRNTNEPLTTTSYNSLSQPSQNNPPFSYGYAQQGLYNAIVTKYNSPDSQSGNYTPIEHGDSQMEGMSM